MTKRIYLVSTDDIGHAEFDRDVPTVEYACIPQEIDDITHIWRPLGRAFEAAEALAEFTRAHTVEVPESYRRTVAASKVYDPATLAEFDWLFEAA